MTQKKITPRAGILVPLPDGNGNLPPDGKVLTLNSYWHQRQFDGDVTFEDPQAVEQETPAVAPLPVIENEAPAIAPLPPKKSRRK